MADRKRTPQNISYISMPMILFVLYIIVTYLLFAIGPISYSGSNKVLAGGFIALFLLVATPFYYFGTHGKIKPHVHVYCNGNELNRVYKTKKLLHFVYIYSFALQLVLVLQNSSVHGVGLNNLFRISFLTQMTQTYTDSEVINTFASWIMSYTGFVKLAALVCGAYYGFRNEKHFYRYIYLGLLALIVIDVMLFVGSQKQLIDLLPYVVIPRMLRTIRNGNQIKARYYLLVGILVIVLIVGIGSVIQSRRDYWREMYNSQSVVSAIGVADMENWLIKLLPESIQYSVLQVIDYISQGYYGLSLCLQLPFVWAKGMGFSFKLMNDISLWFRIPIEQLAVSYPVRMEEAYRVRAYTYWHTAFPWWASDFTWVGAIIIVSIVIYYWGKAWREVRSLNNIPALLMFSHLTVFVMYIPCNNQLFQTRESIVSTIAIFLLWSLYHGKEENYGENLKKGTSLNLKNEGGKCA